MSCGNHNYNAVHYAASRDIQMDSANWFMGLWYYIRGNLLRQTFANNNDHDCYRHCFEVVQCITLNDLTCLSVIACE